MYNVWTHVIQSIIKLHKVTFRIKKIQFKFKYNNNNNINFIETRLQGTIGK